MSFPLVVSIGICLLKLFTITRRMRGNVPDDRACDFCCVTAPIFNLNMGMGVRSYQELSTQPLGRLGLAKKKKHCVILRRSHHLRHTLCVTVQYQQNNGPPTLQQYCDALLLYPPAFAGAQRSGQLFPPISDCCPTWLNQDRGGIRS